MRVGIETEVRTGSFDFIGFNRKFARRVNWVNLDSLAFDVVRRKLSDIVENL